MQPIPFRLFADLAGPGRSAVLTLALTVWLSGTVGCHVPWQTQEAGLPGVPESGILENPLFIPASDPEFIWNQLVDALDDHFRIEKEVRMQCGCGPPAEGRIDTFPQIGSTMLEPWRGDSTQGYEKLHATLQSIRRRAEVHVVPTEGGYWVHVQVYKELEELDRPEKSTVGRMQIRPGFSPTFQSNERSNEPVVIGWIPLGRDLSLEQKILDDLHRRLLENQY